VSDSVINTTTVTAAPITALDSEKLAASGPSGEDIYRERVQVTGAQLAEVARVLKMPPGALAYGLVVRPIGHAHDTDVFDRILATLLRCERHLEAMSDEHVTDQPSDDNET